MVNTTPQVVVAAVEGYAIAGGFGLLCVSDVAICTEDAGFAMSETAIGIVPAQIAPFVAARIGVPQTRHLALTAARFKGPEALRLGIAHHLVKDSAALDAKLEEVLKQIDRCAPFANAATKAVVMKVGTEPLSSVLDFAADKFAEARRSPRPPRACAPSPRNGRRNGPWSDGASPRSWSPIAARSPGGSCARRKAMGYRTVAVYSDADKDAPHVAFADEAVRIGPPPVGESYLSIDRILEAAHKSGADAVHPGYGFLSENEAFAAACDKAGLVFIGPPPAAIAAMGNKAAAKRRMIDAGVPCVPGYQGADQSDANLEKEARKIGLPVMVKAAAGGGGRGMRLVEHDGDLLEAIRTARTEAESAFGSGELILEKAVIDARHVEIQVFADNHGNVIHLGERDCSVQRRHQKVIEEAPSPAVDADLRARMGAAAVAAAQGDRLSRRRHGRVPAGRRRRLLLPRDEHPPAGRASGDRGDHRPRPRRVAAPRRARREPAAHPGAGAAHRPCHRGPALCRGRLCRLPAADRPHRRLAAGDRARRAHRPRHEGRARDLALLRSDDRQGDRPWRHARGSAPRLVKALRDTVVLGPTTNRHFLIRLLEHPEFAAGKATTAFLGKHAFPAPEVSDAHWTLAAVLLWQPSAARYPATCAAGATPIPSRRRSASRSATANARCTSSADGVAEHAPFTDRRQRHRRRSRRLHRALHDRTYMPPASAAAGSDGKLRAPMDGRIVAIKVAAGDKVVRGQTLVVLEAMKIQHQLKAALDAEVESVAVQEGQQVSNRTVLVTMAADAAAR